MLLNPIDAVFIVLIVASLFSVAGYCLGFASGMQHEKRTPIAAPTFSANAASQWDVAPGILLPGFTCKACGAFTGVLKEDLTACRCCDAPRG